MSHSMKSVAGTEYIQMHCKLTNVQRILDVDTYVCYRTAGKRKGLGDGESCHVEFTRRQLQQWNGMITQQIMIKVILILFSDKTWKIYRNAEVLVYWPELSASHQIRSSWISCLLSSCFTFHIQVSVPMKIAALMCNILLYQNFIS